MPRRKDNDDKFALVIWSALREWNLNPSMDECKAGIKLIKSMMAERSLKQLPATFREPTQTKG